MEHLAILKRNWLEKIISGEKTIESRWYKYKRTPYNNVKRGDIIYFKESGKLVTAKALVEKVLFFESLDRDKVIKILHKYGKQIGITESFVNELVIKNYCILVFLEDVQKVEPFKINKKGYPLMSGWISVEDINKLKY